MVKRQGDTITVTCVISGRHHVMSCVGGAWIGNGTAECQKGVCVCVCVCVCVNGLKRCVEVACKPQKRERSGQKICSIMGSICSYGEFSFVSF